jgi:integrase/recombinase XerD
MVAVPSSVLPPDASDELVIALWLKGKSPETVRAYATDMNLFRRFVGRSLRATTLADLHAFADDLEQLEDATIKRRMSAVKSLFSFAHKTGYVAVNVGAAYPLPKLADDLAERILTEEQVQRMLALETNRRNHALLRLLYSAGLRVSEVVGLTWGKIHPREDGRAQLTVVGKGHRTRHVLITGATWAELAVLRGDAQHISMAPAETPVFASRGANGMSGGGHLGTSQVHRIVAAAAKRAGIEGSVSPHWLRHAHASHALDRGVPIHLVRATLGHGSLAVTGRYAHARPTASSSDYLPV